MSDALEEATSRLTKALETFEKTVAERRQTDLTAETLAEQLETATTSLGAERQKSARLAAANDEVSERLDTIIDSVRNLVEAR